MRRPYDPDRHHRRSIRLRGYDYAQAGAYFVTVVTQDRECLFGAVVDGEMRLNDVGRIVQETWGGIPAHHPGIQVDAFVVMPNHVHGILVFPAPAVGAQFIAPRPGAPRFIAPRPGTMDRGPTTGAPAPGEDRGAINRAPTVGDVVRASRRASPLVSTGAAA